MNLRRTLLIAAALCAVAAGSISYGLTQPADGGLNACAEQTRAAAACARCGDGVCARSCETAASCPRDCGGVPSESRAASCGKCGDGVCVRQCGETATSCPRDCGGVPSTVAASAALN